MIPEIEIRQYNTLTMIKAGEIRECMPQNVPHVQHEINCSGLEFYMPKLDI